MVLYGTYGTVFLIASSRPYIVTRSTNCADVVDYYWYWCPNNKRTGIIILIEFIGKLPGYISIWNFYLFIFHVYFFLIFNLPHLQLQ